MKARLLAMVLAGVFLSSLFCQSVPSRIPASKNQPASLTQCVPSARIDREGFRLVMQTVADGWNRGDARRAASCFGEDAKYSGPPSPPHRGRKALYEFFSAAKGRQLPMQMTWHNLLFDPEQQIGAGEYTFRYKEQTHGLVIVKISNGLIVNWREYEVESGLPWEKFVEENRF